MQISPRLASLDEISEQLPVLADQAHWMPCPHRRLTLVKVGEKIAGDEMDFLRELAQMVAVDLGRRGVVCKQKWLDEDPVFLYADYLEFREKRIEPRPRRVLVSDVLRAGPKWSEHEKALEALIRASERGDDLSLFQTKNTAAFRTPDLLLSDWGIHHLHLGRPGPGGSWSMRSPDLLFVKVLDPSEICFIDIRDHKSFADFELLDIIDRNWPAALAEHILPGELWPEQRRDQEGHEALRRAGILTAVPMSSERLLLPPGGGITSIRSSAKCMRRAQKAANDLLNAEEHVRQHIDSCRAELAINPNEEIHLLGYCYQFVIIGPQDGSKAMKIPFTRERP